MSDVNYLDLLKICDLAKQWPKLTALHDIAMADLEKANEDAKAELAKRAAEVAAKVAAEAAKLAAQAKAEADKQKAVDEAAQKAKASPPPPTSGPASTTDVERVV